jgi:bifunctional non-homologous end joining protein LigD
MALKKYRSKRRFDITAEPRGKAARTKGSAFVVQKHAATRLHYDLRLELDGVMKSWAVTRGPSLVPGERRLAVEVEDHPIEYNKFEGTIPKGQYGGGTVMIWDRGSWQPEQDTHRGLQKGHLDFSLEGGKLHGRWHLVRMHRRPGEKRNNWLLIKSDDEWARRPRDKDILEELPLSIATGRTMDEITEGAPKKLSRIKTLLKDAKKPAKKSTTKAATKRKTARRAAAATVQAAESRKSARAPKVGRRRSGSTSRGKNDDMASGGHHTFQPPFIAPSLATLSDKAPDSANWIHEIKFDGYRLQTRLADGHAALLTRKGLDWTRKFEPISEALEALPADTATLDGELVVEAENGVSSFSLLQQDLSAGRTDRMVYYLFDLLYLDGVDLRALPLAERKARLAKLLKALSKDAPLRLSESLEESGGTLLRHACQLGLEGIISKLRDAPYRPGRGQDWLKTKCSDRQELVIAGYAPSTADAQAIGSLIVGYYEGGALRYAGRTGTGYTHKVARDLYRKLNAIRQKECPFGKVPAEERRSRVKAVWVKPELVAEVELSGWTHGGHIRQSTFQGLREDKKATDVVREHKIHIAAARTTAAAKRSAPPARKPKPAAEARDHFGAVRLSNPERVYWKDAGVTKYDLAEYYAKVWDYMKPHLVRRVIAIVRCPEGEGGQCFFQKHASAGLDAKFLHLVKEPDGDKSISIDDLDGLIALAQAGALEIHVRGSTIDRLEDANRLVFDLDPGPGVKWNELIAAAREVRDRLAALKMESFVKTSGGKGLHVVLPIAYTPWEQAKGFARAIAEAMEADDPGRFVSTAAKAKRANRIFVDYLRNSREATAIAPFSTRSRPGAPVAVPLDWRELSTLRSSNQYTVLNITQRLGRLRKDPWANMGKLKPKLPKKL